MKLTVFLVLFLWTATAWSNELDQEQMVKLMEYMQQGTPREKILALSLLPKPRCREQIAPSSDKILKAMADSDPLVREMATFYIRHSIEESNSNSSIPTHVEEPDYTKSASVFPDNPNIARSISKQQRVPSSCGVQPMISALMKAATDPVPRIRMQAALALGFSGEQQAVPTLVALSHDTDPFVRTGAGFALGELRAKTGLSALSTLATTTTGDWRDYFAQREALVAIRKIWAADFRRKISRGSKGDVQQDLFDQNVRSVAVATALKVADDALVRREAFGVLAEIKAPEAIGHFRSGARDADPVVRFSALRGLFRFADDKQLCNDCSAIFNAAATDTDARVRSLAISGLGRVAVSGLNDDNFKALRDPNDSVRKAAIAAVRSTEPKSMESLAALLYEKQDIRELALKSLYLSTREDSDSVNPLREPVAQAGRSYLWIEPKARQKKDKPEKPAPRTEKSKARLQNNAVVEKVMAVFPNLTSVEKLYALEIIGRFDHANIPAFIQSNIGVTDPDVVIKAMNISMAYTPAASFPLITKNLTSKNVRIRDAAELIVSDLDMDLPAEGFVWMAEAPDPAIRRKFFSLAKNLSDPALVSLCLKGLHDSSADVRRVSVEYFQEHQDPRTVIPLSAMLGGSKEVASAAVKALASQDNSAFEVLFEVIADTTGKYDVAVKTDALFGIVNHDQNKTGAALLELLKKAPDGPLSDSLIRALVGLKEHRAVPLLLRLMKEENKNSNLISKALFFLGDSSALDQLEEIIENPGETLQKRKWAIQSCAGIGVSGTRYLLGLAIRSAELRQAAVEHLQIQKTEDRRIVAEIAGKSPQEYRSIVAAIGGAFYRIPLDETSKLLHDSNPHVVKGAVLLLRATANPKSIAYLRELEKGHDQSLRELVAEAISILGQKKSNSPVNSNISTPAKR